MTASDRGAAEGGERREVRSPEALDRIAFGPDGLVPVVAQDVPTGRVLMVAWANRDALERTLATGEMHYWSRSRKALWRKGETSGHTQRLVSLHRDCDADTLLARVVQTGPACHTGTDTCFAAGHAGEVAGGGREAHAVEATQRGGEARTGPPHPGAATPAGGEASVLAELWSVLEARDRDRPEGSYTTLLLTDENRRIKKLGEEMAELISALVTRGENIPEEAADLVYHLLVALRGAGRSWEEVEAELRKRRGPTPEG